MIEKIKSGLIFCFKVIAVLLIGLIIVGLIHGVLWLVEKIFGEIVFFVILCTLAFILCGLAVYMSKW